MNNKIIVRTLTTLFFALLIGIGFVVLRNSEADLSSLTANSAEKVVTIEPGSSPDQIANQLVEEQIITNSDSFTKHARNEGVSVDLKAGTYLLDSSMTVDKIVDIIASGKEATKTLTILPGLSEEEIKQVFVEAGFDKSRVEQAFSNIMPKNYIKDVSAERLEGYIAPDTYSLGLSASVEDYLIFALQQFGKSLTQEMIVGFSEQELSVNGATILASIVQQESSLPENQVKIAQVFLKRLEEGIPLGADPTFRYGARQLGLAETPDVDSLYNTRIHAGLTPTPIGNFNTSALEAVANPADSDYLFFVSGDDGITYFSKTLAEHEALAAEHCIELCKL